MKKFLIVFFQLFVLTYVLCAENSLDHSVWTIGQNGDFRNVDEAMADDRVVDGDVLKLQKGFYYSRMQTVNKCVKIEGNGYKDKSDGYAYGFYLDQDNIVLTGIYAEAVEVRANGVIIERSRIAILTGGTFTENKNNATIRGCFITSWIEGYGTNKNHCENWYIHNNIIIAHTPSPTAISCLINAKIDHNLIVNLDTRYANSYAIDDIQDSELTNNIIIKSNYNQAVPSRVFSSIKKFEYNIHTNVYNDSKWPNNISGYAKKESELFVCEGENNSDSYYRLVKDSPALGYSNDGFDCGPWSGAFPYLINGLENYENVSNSDDLLDFINGLVENNNKGTEENPVLVPVGDNGLTIDKDVVIGDDLQLLFDGEEKGNQIPIYIEGGTLTPLIGSFLMFVDVSLNNSSSQAIGLKGEISESNNCEIDIEGKVVFANSTLKAGSYMVNNRQGGILIIKENTSVDNGLIVNSGNLYIDGSCQVSGIIHKKGGRIYLTSAPTNQIGFVIESASDIEQGQPILMGADGYEFTENDLQNLSIELPVGFDCYYDSDYKALFISVTDGLSTLRTPLNAIDMSYDMYGRLVDGSYQGMTILRMNDGTTKKIVITK